MTEEKGPGKTRTVGVISDTHGLVRPEVERTLLDVDMIIHAGDVGDPRVLDLLGRIAPVVAVRGNMDKGQWAQDLPETEVVEIEDVLLYVLHDINRLDLEPSSAGFRGVIFGHSHQPSAVKEKGVLFLNPGSAGPGRFRLPISLALLSIEGNRLEARFLGLNV